MLLHTVVHKIDPLLKMMKLRKSVQENRTTEEAELTKMVTPLTRQPSSLECLESGPEKCVTLNVLAEPPPGSPIRADVIFIHGLHGK